MRLTFAEVKNLGGDRDIFDQSVVLSERISYLTGADPVTVAHALGKSLKDPASAPVRLRPFGVSFTPDQKDQIGTFIDATDLPGAQMVVLLELRSQFGHGVLG